jgi:hypothetical protein
MTGQNEQQQRGRTSNSENKQRLKTGNGKMRGSFTSFRMTTRDMVQDNDVSVQHDDMQRQKQRQRLAGLGYTFPPIAKSAMDGHPFCVGLLRKTGDDL